MLIRQIRFELIKYIFTSFRLHSLLSSIPYEVNKNDNKFSCILIMSTFLSDHKFEPLTPPPSPHTTTTTTLDVNKIGTSKITQ